MFFPSVCPYIPPAGASYITQTSSGADTNSYTFSSVSIGTASADRVVVVCPHGLTSSGTNTVTSVTINGFTMNEACVTSTGAFVSGVYYYPLASGTTADIVVTYNIAMVRSGIGVYALTSLSSQTPYHTATNYTAASTSLSVSINYQDGGAVIGGAAVQVTADEIWTNLTETYDIGVGGEGNSMNGAYKTTSTSATGETITITPGSSSIIALAVASWR